LPIPGLEPDDITRIYFRDPAERRWHTLRWEHAPSVDMPLGEDALGFARKLAASTDRDPDGRFAVADLLRRWNLGWARRWLSGVWCCGWPPATSVAVEAGDDDDADLDELVDLDDFYADGLDDV
jgi:hypothetical protein